MKAVVAQHRRYRTFRRSLRQLAVEDAVVSRARAESRLQQVSQIRVWNREQRDTTGKLAVALFKIERLADALAEGEFDDMGVDRTEAETELASVIHQLRSARKSAER